MGRIRGEKKSLFPFFFRLVCERNPLSHHVAQNINQQQSFDKLKKHADGKRQAISLIQKGQAIFRNSG